MLWKWFGDGFSVVWGWFGDALKLAREWFRDALAMFGKSLAMVSGRFRMVSAWCEDG